MNLSRRKFAGLLSLAPFINMSNVEAKKKGEAFPISANAYNWFTFYRREGKEWGVDWDACIGEYAKTGLKAFEPGLNDLKQTKEIIAAVKKHGIAMPSVYVNSVLHEKQKAKESIKAVLDIADVLLEMNTKIMVTNPSPIKWGGEEIKTDAELRVQAGNLEMLGKQLKKRGITLAYHTHDVELRAGAREFHHMLQNTSAKNVSFCYDIHWVYRGSQDSEVAVFDILKMYGDRIVELHIRQSKGGIWSETFSQSGDINYQRFADELKKHKIKTHLVIEQCIEAQTPGNMDAITAHIKDLAEVARVFQT
jgi:inosose dehydratase